MNRRRILIGICLIILLLGIFSNWNRISDRMFRVYSSMIASQARNTECFWFSHVGIDSLYKINGYRYCAFMKDLGDSIDMDALSVYKDSILIVTEGDLKRKGSGREYDKVNLPESAFYYLLEEGEEMVLCTIDSVTQSRPYKYQMRKIRK